MIKILLVFLVIFVAACLPGTTSSTGPPVHEGRDGLELTFFEGAPPDSVFEGSSMPVALLIENKGAVDIDCNSERGCGEFLMFARPPIEFSETDSLQQALTQTSEELLSGRESYSSGGKAALEIENVPVTRPLKETTATVFATACYPYTTKLLTTICVDTAPIQLTEQQRACELDTMTFNHQGAPVAIRKIEQRSFVETSPTGNIVRPLLRIFIENVNDGFVLSDTSRALEVACTSESLPTENSDPESVLGLINVSARIADNELVCNNNRPFKLTGIREDDVVECIVLRDNGFNVEEFDNSFKTTLSVQVNYGYYTSISKQVDIELLADNVNPEDGIGSNGEACYPGNRCDEDFKPALDENNNNECICIPDHIDRVTDFVPKKENGAECTNDHDCISDFCDSDNICQDQLLT